MLGDDSNPTEMTERVRFGAGFGHTQEGVDGCAERLGGQTRGTRETRLVSERTTERRGNYERTKSFKKTCRCDVDDAMMNAIIK